jgi:opacity protein-like surface antigen
VPTARPSRPGVVTPRADRPVRLALGGLLVLLAALAAPAAAQDSDRPRFYLGLRGMGTNPATGVHDPWGLSLGASLGRYWGVELSADAFERFPRIEGRTIGEYGILALVPQLRLRYPLLDGRLTPYVLGGIGIGFTDLNDVKPPAFTARIEHESSMLLGSVGTGIEYFIADNIALGVELKYIVAEEQTLVFNGARHTLDLDSLLTSFSMRVFFPELRPAPLAEQRPQAPHRLYFVARLGGAVSVDDTLGGLRVKHEPPAYFETANQFFGLGLGLDFARHFSVELAVEGYEVRLAVPGLGSIGEYSVAALLPQARLRYPLLDGRVVPYLIGGVGLSQGEFNDTKPRGRFVDIDGSNTYGVAAALGGGIEYFVASNVAVGVETRYLMSRGHSIRVDGRRHAGNLDSVAVMLALRVMLADFNW